MTNKTKCPTCSRCGANVQELYLFKWKDEDEEEHADLICWHCDWDIANGQGDMTTDPADIYQDRMEEAYQYDPINNPPPERYYE